MPANRTGLVIILISLLLRGCVEPYTPDIKESQELLVVEALLTDQPGFQHIYVSRSSPFNDPRLVTEDNCYIRVFDDKGHAYTFYRRGGAGKYICSMSASDLVRGTSYKLSIITNEGKEYESDYELLSSPCPPIDSVYFEMETIGTTNPDHPLEGIQFYIDMHSDNDQARNFRWELEESYQYNSANIIQYYYDGVLHPMPDPFEFFICWYTGRIDDIYTFSTRHSQSNSISKYPLKYISNRTSRLKVRYSLLVRQYSLSYDAFQYWDQMRRQNQESGGLYETQPSHIRGNIHNINDPDEQVLGFFNVSSASEKRIFVDGIRELSYPRTGCFPDTIEYTNQIPGYMTFPVYLRSASPFGTGPPYIIGRYLCFDCRNGGGINVKPDFWE